MKEKIPWSAVLILALLVILGIGLPFWLEFRSLSHLEPDRPRRHTPVLEEKYTFFCPICGGEVTFHHWHVKREKKEGSVQPLYLERLTGSGWEVPLRSASPLKSPAEIHD